MVWPAIIAAAAATAQGAGNLWSSNHAARKAWSRAKEAAQNAHQWEVNDLRAAGLNPVLSATGGSGASAQPFMATAPAIDAVSDAEKGMASAKLQADIDNSTKVADAQAANYMANSAEAYARIANDKLRVENELLNGESSRNLNTATVGLHNAQTELAGATTGLTRGRTARLRFENGLTIAQTDLARAQRTAAIASARQSNANAFGQEMTNQFYSANPGAIEAREMARAYGTGTNTLYRIGEVLQNDTSGLWRGLKNFFTPTPNGAKYNGSYNDY